MVSFVSDLGTSFLLGLLTPLTAVCVLPLYPGFLSFLAHKLQGEASRKKIALFGLIVTLGVIVFMGLLGFIFTFALKVSLTKVIGIISPIAFALLAVISLLLILNVDFARFLPTVRAPTTQSPLASAFLFGFFFGAIVVPCNPLFIAALFTTAFSTAGLILNMLQFFAFGIGIGFPLLLISFVSATKSRNVIRWLTRHKRAINVITGSIMLVISIYYLACVFAVFGLGMVVEPVCKPLSVIFGVFT